MAAFVLDLAAMVGAVSLPFVVFNQLGGAERMSGTLAGMQSLGYALVCVISSRYVSRAKNGIRIAMVGVAICMSLYVFVPFARNVYLCGALAVMALSSLALVWPALHSWVGGEPDARLRSRRMGSFNISWSSGFIVGPLFAGPLYDFDYRAPFLFMFVLGVITFLLLWSLPHEKQHFAVQTEEANRARTADARRSETMLYAAWCATIVANFLVAATRSVYPKRIQDLVVSGELRLLFESTPAAFLTTNEATKYSWLAATLSLSTAATFVILGRTSFWQHRIRYVVGLQILSAAAFWALVQTRSLVIMGVCFAAVGLLPGMAFFSSTYYSLSNGEHKHRRATLNEACVGIGGFSGSMAFGHLARIYGIGMPFAYTPWFIAAAIAAQFGLVAYGRRKAERTPQ